MQSKNGSWKKCTLQLSIANCTNIQHISQSKQRKLTPIEKRSKKQVSCKRKWRKVAIGFNFVSNGVKMVQVVWIDLQAK